MKHAAAVGVIFRTLPRDALHVVLEYYGKIVYRHGRYMNRISDDELDKIEDMYFMQPRPQYTKSMTYACLYLKISPHKDYYIIFDGINNRQQQHKNKVFLIGYDSNRCIRIILEKHVILYRLGRPPLLNSYMYYDHCMSPVVEELW